MNNEQESFYEDITMKAVADTVAKLLKYPFGFHGDTGIREYLYARLHSRGGKNLDVNDERPGYSTLLLQAEHYTHIKYTVTGKTGLRARFDLALAAPPESEELEDRYAHKLDALFAFELGKNKAKTYVIDDKMLSHKKDDVVGTSDISKLYRELKHQDLKQGWAIEFYDSSKQRGVRLNELITSSLELCQQVQLKKDRKLVVIFVGYSPDGKHHLSSNDQTIQAALTETLAAGNLDARPENAPYSPPRVMQGELFVRGHKIIKYDGKICHLACKGYSFTVRHFSNGSFAKIYSGRNDRKKYLSLEGQIQVLKTAPREKIKNTAFWENYFKSLDKDHQQ